MTLLNSSLLFRSILINPWLCCKIIITLLSRTHDELHPAKLALLCINRIKSMLFRTDHRFLIFSWTGIESSAMKRERAAEKRTMIKKRGLTFIRPFSLIEQFNGPNGFIHPAEHETLSADSLTLHRTNGELMLPLSKVTLIYMALSLRALPSQLIFQRFCTFV